MLVEINQSGVLGVDQNGNALQLQGVPGFPLSAGFDKYNPDDLIGWFYDNHRKYIETNPLIADESPTIQNQIDPPLVLRKKSRHQGKIIAEQQPVFDPCPRISNPVRIDNRIPHERRRRGLR